MGGGGAGPVIIAAATTVALTKLAVEGGKALGEVILPQGRPVQRLTTSGGVEGKVHPPLREEVPLLEGNQATVETVPADTPGYSSNVILDPLDAGVPPMVVSEAKSLQFQEGFTRKERKMINNVVRENGFNLGGIKLWRGEGAPADIALSWSDDGMVFYDTAFNLSSETLALFIVHELAHKGQNIKEFGVGPTSPPPTTPWLISAPASPAMV